MLGAYGDRQACLKRIVELKDLHRFSSAGTMIDGLNGTAHETAPWRRILDADRRVHIRHWGACAPLVLSLVPAQNLLEGSFCSPPAVQADTEARVLQSRLPVPDLLVPVR